MHVDSLINHSFCYHLRLRFVSKCAGWY